MKKFCIPISKKNYDLANMLFKERYGEELEIETNVCEIISLDSFYCKNCGGYFGQPSRDIHTLYCPRCGVMLKASEDS